MWNVAHRTRHTHTHFKCWTLLFSGIASMCVCVWNRRRTVPSTENPYFSHSFRFGQFFKLISPFFTAELLVSLYHCGRYIPSIYACIMQTFRFVVAHRESPWYSRFSDFPNNSPRSRSWKIQMALAVRVRIFSLHFAISLILLLRPRPQRPRNNHKYYFSENSNG